MKNNELLNESAKKGGLMKGSKWWGIFLFLLLVFVDQLTKLLADVYFSSAGSPSKISFIPNWIEFRITYNRGISYGLGSDASPVLKIAVIAVTGIMMAGLAVLYCKTDKRRSWLNTALVFIVSGGAGNLIDRVYYRVWEANGAYGVRDMVDLSRFGFAVCNFADFFISIGAVILVLALLFLDTDAVFPATKKYKALAKEAEEKAEAKKQAKQNNG
ncbi:MAG: signal peptidase II [Clostridiales bacterium]|nr:signal peptidase II [Clostridiales bacterium]